MGIIKKKKEKEVVREVEHPKRKTYCSVLTGPFDHCFLNNSKVSLFHFFLTNEKFQTLHSNSFSSVIFLLAKSELKFELI